MNSLLNSLLLGFVCGLALLSHPCMARVFDFKNENFAVYFRGTGGLSSVGQDPYGGALGDSIRTNHEVQYNISGELGVLIASGGALALRLGVELLQPRPVSGEPIKNNSGTELYQLDSDIFAFNPLGAIEYHFGKQGHFKWIAYVGVGYANVTLENKYNMTSDGEANLGLSSYSEKSEANLINYNLGCGFETLFVDNVTFQMDLGYRIFSVKELSHKSNVTSIPGTFEKGDTLTNTDGSKRNFDMGGFYLGLAFRFYISFI